MYEAIYRSSNLYNINDTTRLIKITLEHSLTDEHMGYIVNALITKNIQILEFHLVGFTSDQIKMLIKALNANTSITQFYFYNIRTTDDDIENMLNSLQNKKLTKLILERIGMNAVHATALCNLLTNGTIKTVSIYDNLFDEGIFKIFDTLKNNDSITTLYIGDMGIRTKHIDSMMKSINTMTGLRKLSIRHTYLHVIDVNRVFEMLCDNKFIISFNYVSAGLHDDSSHSIAKFLMKNNIIKDLNISYNRIGTEGARIITDALKFNTTLVNLDFRGNDAGNNGRQYLIDAIKVNGFLKILDIGVNGAELPDEEFIKAQLVYKWNLEEVIIDGSYTNVVDKYTLKNIKRKLQSLSTIIDPSSSMYHYTLLSDRNTNVLNLVGAALRRIGAGRDQGFALDPCNGLK